MLAAVPHSCGIAVLPAIDDGAVVHPRAEHGADGLPHLLVGVLGEVLARSFLDRLLEALDQFLADRLSFSSVSSLTPLACFSSSMIFSNGSISCLLLRLEAEHHVAVHLHEAAIAVPGEAFVAGLLDQAAQGGFVEADVEDGVHHARHADAGPGAARDEQRVLGVAELGPHRPPRSCFSAASTCAFSSGG